MLTGFAWVELFVESAPDWCDYLCRRMGFTLKSAWEDEHTRTHALSSGALLLVSEARSGSGPVHEHLRCHPQGVGDVAFRCRRLPEIPLRPGRLQGTWQVTSPAGVTHTFVPETSPIGLLGELPSSLLPGVALDHVVLNVEAGAFERTIDWYRRGLGLQPSRYFEISTPRSALKSWVLNDPEGQVRLPVNAPLTPNSQVGEFLEANLGPGVQHVALRVADIAGVVERMRTSGVQFLATPNAYYESLGERLDLAGLDLERLRRLDILVDEDENPGRLLQIFTRPLFSEPTLFFELIERQGQASGFGHGNFQSLFEAIEREQLGREAYSSAPPL